MASLTDEVVEGSFWGACAKFLDRFGALALTIILARFLLPENFGVYSLTMSIAVIFMTFADLGINQALIRYFSLNLKNKKKSAAYFQYILKIKFLVSITIALLLLVLAYPLSFFIFKKPELFVPLLLSAVFIFTLLFVFFFSSPFYAIKKVKYIGIKELIFQIARIVIVLIIFFSIPFVYYIYGIIIGLILTNLLVLFILIIWLKKLAPFIFEKSKEKIDKIGVLKFLSYVTIASLSLLLFIYVDTIMLGFFVSFSYVGFYKVAFSFVLGIAGLFGYLGLVLIPIFTKLEGQRLGKVFNKVLRFILIFSIPSVFGILALGKYFIRFLFGWEYLPSTFPFYFLSLMLISYIPTMLIRTLFLSKGKSKYVAKVTLIALFLNIVLNYTLISSLLRISETWAMMGAAIATITSRYTLSFCFMRLTKKKLSIKIKKMSFIKPILAGFIMFSVIKIINLFIIKDMNLFIGVCEIFFGILIYFLLMFLIKGVVKEDIEIIKKIPLPKNFFLKNGKSKKQNKIKRYSDS